MSKRIYLSSPHLGSNEITNLKRIITENWIAPAGPDLEAFENELADTVSAKDSCAVHSATAALHLALRLLNVGPRDLVFVQTHNHIGSVNPIMYQGATPVFIDSEPHSWNMSPEHLEEAIKSALDGSLKSKVQSSKLSEQPTLDFKTLNLKPACILPVHLYGMPANMDAILAIGEKYGLPVIEDAAESLGSTYNNKHTGTFGKLGAYSFNGNKIITTGGGGALVADDKTLIERARFLATQAREPVPHFQHEEVGYNYRLSNVLAGIGRGQIQVLPERIAQRRANFERYRQYFAKWNEKGFDIRFQEEEVGSCSNRWLTAILVNPIINKGLTREDIRLALEAEIIEARPLWKPMHMQPVFESYPFFGDGTSERLFDTGLCLPSGSILTEEDFSRIASCLDGVFGSRR